MRSISHYHLTPLAAKVKELLQPITFSEEMAKNPRIKALFNLGEKNRTWKLSDTHPKMARDLMDWSNYIVGQSVEHIRPYWIERGLKRLMNHLTYSIMGLSFRSAAIQPLALKNTIAEIGYTHTTLGIEKMLTPKDWNRAMDFSDVLYARTFETAVGDVMSLVNRGTIMDLVKSGKILDLHDVIGRKSLAALKALDSCTAVATWLGAYEFGVKKLGLSRGKKGEAKFYADEVVLRTQASALPGHRAPIQRPLLGRALTLFQTFVINDWRFLTHDVMGIKNAKMNNVDVFKSAMRYITAGMLFNWLIEDLGRMTSPSPRPVKALTEAVEGYEDEGAWWAVWNVGKEIIEPVPLASSKRYGKSILGAVAQFVDDITSYPLREAKYPWKNPYWLEMVGMTLGLYGTRQASKMHRAWERGGNWWEILSGAYVEPKREYKGLEGLRGLGGMSELK
jgi:hypothetical protein